MDSPADGQLGCFRFLAAVNNAALHVQVHVSVWIHVFVLLGRQTGIAGSYGNSMLSHLSCCQTVWFHVFLIYSHLLLMENKKLYVEFA